MSAQELSSVHQDYTHLILKAFQKPYYLFKLTTGPSLSHLPYCCVKITLPLDYRYRAMADN